YASRMDPAAAQEPPAEPGAAGAPEPLLTDDQTRGAEEVGRPSADPTRLPPWIPRLLLALVITVFASYAAFSLIRRLSHLLLWLRAALVSPFSLQPAGDWRAAARGRGRGGALRSRPAGADRRRANGSAGDRPGAGADRPGPGLARSGERVHPAVVRHQADERHDPETDRERAGGRARHRRERRLGRRVPARADLPGAHDRPVHVLPRGRRPEVPARRVLAPAAAGPARPPRGPGGGARPPRWPPVLEAPARHHQRDVLVHRAAVAGDPVRGAARPVAGVRLAVHPGGGHLHRRGGPAARGVARGPVEGTLVPDLRDHLPAD